MPIPAPFSAFWRAFGQASGGADDGRFYEAFSFGDSPAMADELAQLVLQGSKRATAGSAWSFDAAGKRLPQPGDLSIVTDGAGRALCVIETLQVDVLPFLDVPAAFAAAEGEGDGSLAYWRDAHRAYFQRECARAGRTFSEHMPVVCERFAVVYRATAGLS